MSNVISKVSSENWFTRMKNALIGIVIGIIMFFVSFVILFWNEGNAVYEAKSIAEGEKSVREVSADTVDPASNGKLIHISGLATTSDITKDPDFQIEETAIRLNRQVEMYQWEEKTEKKTRDKLGGTRETITTFSYQKVWASGRNDSDRFEESEGHSNPTLQYRSDTWTADKVSVGAFKLNDALVGKIAGSEERPFTDEDFGKLDQPLKDKAVVHAGQLYWSASGPPDPGKPVIGDIRISHSVTMPAEVSAMARQEGNDLEHYETSIGSGVLQLRMGKMSAEAMFSKSKEELSSLTWILRFVGFAAMGIGIFLMLSPIAVFFEVIPLLGNIATGGIAVIAALIAAPLSLITISIAWIFYRPLVGCALLAAAAGCIGLLFWAIRKYRKSQPSQAVAPQMNDDVPTVY